MKITKNKGNATEKKSAQRFLWGGIEEDSEGNLALVKVRDYAVSPQEGKKMR